MEKDNSSLSHTKWNFKYHIVFGLFFCIHARNAHIANIHAIVCQNAPQKGFFAIDKQFSTIYNEQYPI